MYEEGLQIPMLKILRAGEPNDDVLEIIRTNVRQPDETIGDIYAQISSNEVGADRLRSLLDEFDLPDVEEIADEIISRSERAMRAGIAALPDGTYTNEAWTDGFDEPIVLRCTVTVAGDEMTVDWAGSSPQSPYGINVVLNYTHAYASFAMKAAVAPEVPHNDGAFRPVHVTAPLGSILNCEHPAPVASRHVIGHFLPGIIFGALAPAVPGRLLAGSADALWITVWQGRDRRRRPFVQTVFQLGGMGARTGKDGLSATGFPSGVAGHARRGRRVAEPARLPPARADARLRRRRPLPRRPRAGSRDHVLDRRCVVGLGAARPHAGIRRPASRTGSRAPRAPTGCSAATTCRSSASCRCDRPTRSSCACPAAAATARRRPAIPRRCSRDVVEGYVSIEQARALYGVAIRYVGRRGRARPPAVELRARSRGHRARPVEHDELRAKSEEQFRNLTPAVSCSVRGSNQKEHDVSRRAIHGRRGMCRSAGPGCRVGTCCHGAHTAAKTTTHHGRRDRVQVQAVEDVGARRASVTFVVTNKGKTIHDFKINGKKTPDDRRRARRPRSRSRSPRRASSRTCAPSPATRPRA